MEETANTTASTGLFLEGEFLRRVSEVVAEISRHKWIESEKAGRDIGGNAAARDWIERYYEDWKEAKGY